MEQRWVEGSRDSLLEQHTFLRREASQSRDKKVRGSDSPCRTRVGFTSHGQVTLTAQDFLVCAL